MHESGRGGGDLPGGTGRELSDCAAAADGTRTGSYVQLCGFEASSCMGLAAGNDTSMRSQALQQALHDVAFITNNAVEQYVVAPCAIPRSHRAKGDRWKGREGRGGRGRKEGGEKGEALTGQRLRSRARDAAGWRAVGMCARSVRGLIVCARRVLGGRS